MTQFISKNVKNLRNHVVGRRFHNEAKPWETFHCALFLPESLYNFLAVHFIGTFLNCCGELMNEYKRISKQRQLRKNKHDMEKT